MKDQNFNSTNGNLRDTWTEMAANISKDFITEALQECRSRDRRATASSRNQVKQPSASTADSRDARMANATLPSLGRTNLAPAVPIKKGKLVKAVTGDSEPLTSTALPPSPNYICTTPYQPFMSSMPPQSQLHDQISLHQAMVGRSGAPMDSLRYIPDLQLPTSPILRPTYADLSGMMPTQNGAGHVNFDTSEFSFASELGNGSHDEFGESSARDSGNL